jgi:hypothetical protein
MAAEVFFKIYIFWIILSLTYCCFLSSGGDSGSPESSFKDSRYDRSEEAKARDIVEAVKRIETSRVVKFARTDDHHELQSGVNTKDRKKRQKSPSDMGRILELLEGRGRMSDAKKKEKDDEDAKSIRIESNRTQEKALMLQWIGFAAMGCVVFVLGGLAGNYWMKSA